MTTESAKPAQSVYTIVVTDDRHGAYEEERAVLREVGGEVIVANCATPDEVVQAAREADGVLCNLAPMPAPVIAALRKCRVISRYGIGCDNVDIPAATARGIWVTNVPGYCAEEVSDHTLALLLACLRQVPKLDRAVRQGRWNIVASEPVRRFRGKTYGLVGYGAIARTVRRKLRGFEPGQVLAYDPFVDNAVFRADDVTRVSLEDLCRRSDFISVHTPLTEQTRKLIGPSQLAAMKPTAIFINVSRGPVVDEAALLQALQRGGIYMAGLDVFEQEPPAPDHPFFKLDNVVLSDHAGYFSLESFTELKTTAARNIAAVLTSGKPLHPVNKIAGKVMAR